MLESGRGPVVYVNAEQEPARVLADALAAIREGSAER